MSQTGASSDRLKKSLTQPIEPAMPLPQVLNVNELNSDKWVPFGLANDPADDLSNSRVLRARKQRRANRQRNKESDRVLFAEEEE